MKKRLTILLASLLAFGLALTACGSNDGNNSNTPSPSAPETEASSGERTKVTLAYWAKEESLKTLLDLIKQKLPDVELEYQFIEVSQFSTIVRTKLAAGEGPDIFGGNNVMDRNTVNLGYFEDLTSRYADKYLDAGKAVATYDGKLYGLPQASWFNGIFYNKDLFAKYKLKTPTTLDEYKQVAETFKKNDIVPQAIGLKNPLIAGQSFIALAVNDYLGTSEGKDFDEGFSKGEKKMEDALAPALTTWYDTYIKGGIFSKDDIGVEPDQALDSFATGKAAMLQSGPWDVEAIQAKNPDMKLGMFPNLGTKGGPGWMVGGPGVTFALNSHSEVKDAAYQVLDLITSPEGQQAYWNDNKGGSSYVKGVTFEMPEVFADSQAAFQAGNVYYPPNKWGVGRDPGFEELGRQLQEMILTGKSEAEVLAIVDKKQADLLAKSE
ncbi:ABC transporter substrate-binding protein [Paenibacillus sp. GCM10023252]|uniref:ABC transporter substrate-binding protein n=1 Tax=Paenibacillus sp. GCM10023252 TaxID=3252649 RepID=UPI003616ACFF